MRFASAFANRIDDLELLKDYGRLDIDGNIPRILEANSEVVADNFLRKWGNPPKLPLPNKPPGSWKAQAPDGTWLTRYPSTQGDPGRWTLRFQLPDGKVVKVRFGDRVEN